MRSFFEEQKCCFSLRSAGATGTASEQMELTYSWKIGLAEVQTPIVTFGDAALRLMRSKSSRGSVFRIGNSFGAAVGAAQLAQKKKRCTRDRDRDRRNRDAIGKRPRSCCHSRFGVD
mmetsp:Transcript_15642/g.34199  ORF Transcript_15642/g.34199 Transcript_15642/m.34199 type:complete len:117 (-) Transcript_15642:99-449(-)